uniref:Uncharacterized protein n=1 Tax=Oryza brachyantha TaxID=4533 RepID=J3L8U0_ORYBR
MDLAMALAVLFFCLLLLSSAAIAFLLLRHALSALRRCRRNTGGGRERRARAAGGCRRCLLLSKSCPSYRRTEGVEGLVDRRLGDDYDAAEAGDVARIGIECLAAQPGLRPAMAQVRAAIAEKAARSISIAAAAAGDHSELHGSNST